MPLKYNGKKIIPAPAVGISKDFIKASDGKKVGATFNITLEGHLIPQMGSPNSLGVFHEDSGEPSGDSVPENKIQYSLFKKTEAIRDLFSTDGKLLEISSNRLFESNDDNDAPAISGFARVTSIDFPSNIYHTVLPYTINLELDEIMCQQLREESFDPTICEQVPCDTECTRMEGCEGDTSFVGTCPGDVDNYPSSFVRDGYSLYTFDVLPNDRYISDFGSSGEDLRVYSHAGAESMQPGGDTRTLIHSWWDNIPYSPSYQPWSYNRYPEPVFGSNYVRARSVGTQSSTSWANNFRNTSSENHSVSGHKGLLIGFWFNSNQTPPEHSPCTNRVDDWNAESMAVEGLITKSSITSEWSAGKTGATQNTSNPIESMLGEWGIYSHMMPQTEPLSWSCGAWNVGLGFYVNVTDSDKTATLNSQSGSSTALRYTDGVLHWPDANTENIGEYDSKSTGFNGWMGDDSSGWGLVFYLIDKENKQAYCIVQFVGETTQHIFKVQDWTGNIRENPTQDFNVFYNAGYGNTLNDGGDLRGAFAANYNMDCGLDNLFTIPIESFGAGFGRYNDVIEFHSSYFNKNQIFSPYYSLDDHGNDASTRDADLTITNGSFKTSTTNGYNHNAINPVSNVGDYFMSFDSSSQSVGQAPVKEISATYSESNGYASMYPDPNAGGRTLVANPNTTGYMRVLFWINVANVVGVTGHTNPEMGIITRGGADFAAGTGSGQWGLYGKWNASSSKFEIHAHIMGTGGAFHKLDDHSGVQHIELDPGEWYLCEFELDSQAYSYSGYLQHRMVHQKVGGVKQGPWIKGITAAQHFFNKDTTTPLRIGYNSDAPTASNGYLGSEGGEILLQGIAFSSSNSPDRPTGFPSIGQISFDDYFNSGLGRVHHENPLAGDSHESDELSIFCSLFPAQQKTSGGPDPECPCGITYVDCLEQADWDGLNSCIGSEDYGSALQNIIAESGQPFMDLFSIPEGSTWDSEYASQNPDRVFLSSVDESWGVDDAGSIKGTDNYTPNLAGETVSIETDNSPMFSLTHTVSAQGKRAYNSEGLIREPWQNSKMWVDSRLGIPSGDASYQIQMPVDVTPVGRMFKMEKSRSDYLTGNNVRPNVNRFSLVDDNGDGKIDYSPYNYTRQHTVDKSTGNYSITESWTLAKTKSKANVIEEITSEVSESQESDKTRTVVINGQINGLESRGMDLEIIQSKYEAALERYEELTENIGYDDTTNSSKLIYLIAKQHDAEIKEPHVSKAVTFNEVEGSITFNYNFNNRTQTIEGSISETISIDIKEAEDKYAIIPIVGRSSGPVIQELDTVTAFEATVTAEVIMGDSHRDKGPPVVNETNTLWKKVWQPTGYTLSDLKNITKNESWDPISGTYNKTKTYHWLSNNTC